MGSQPATLIATNERMCSRLSAQGAAAPGLGELRLHGALQPLSSRCDGPAQAGPDTSLSCQLQPHRIRQRRAKPPAGPTSPFPF